MRKMELLFCVFIVLLIPFVATAEDYLGFPAYPGAKKDAVTEKACKTLDPSGKYAYCFRTSDKLDKVVEYYKQKSNLTSRVIPGLMAVFCPKSQEECSATANGLVLSIYTPWTTKSPRPIKEGDFENKDVFIQIMDNAKRLKGLGQ